MNARIRHGGFGVIIPARYGSTRLPGKPLIDIGGRPMVVRVMEVAERAGAAFSIVATDDQRIADVVTLAGGDAVMTSPEHATGLIDLLDSQLGAFERRRVIGRHPPGQIDRGPEDDRVIVLGVCRLRRQRGSEHE